MIAHNDKAEIVDAICSTVVTAVAFAITTKAVFGFGVSLFR